MIRLGVKLGLIAMTLTLALLFVLLWHNVTAGAVWVAALVVMAYIEMGQRPKR